MPRRPGRTPRRSPRIVWDYCVARRVPFKFVPGPHLLHLRNAKYAPRDGSGKFVTVYPADEEQLHRVLRELGALLEGFEGPYILTDLRWDEGPLYVRYGAFARALRRGRARLAGAGGAGRRGAAGARPAGAVLPGARVGDAARVPRSRIWPRGTPRRWASCPTASRRRCTSPTVAGCTRAPTPATGARSSSRRGGRTRGWPPTAPTRSPGWSGRSTRWSRSRARAWSRRCATGSSSATTASW